MVNVGENVMSVFFPHPGNRFGRVQKLVHINWISFSPLLLVHHLSRGGEGDGFQQSVRDEYTKDRSLCIFT